MVLLAIDASTSTGTVALFQGERLLGEASVPMRGATEERLMPAVLQLVLRHASWGAVDRIAVGGGPGSFTSLRIAASIGKGLAHACGVALWSVPSLPLTVAQDPDLAPGRYVATLDAMRGEYYVSIVDVARDGSIGSGDVAVARVPVSSIAEYTRTAGGVAIGPEGPVAVVARPHARGARRLLAAGLGAEVDLAAWEPDYGRLAEAQVKWEAAHGRPLQRGGV